MAGNCSNHLYSRRQTMKILPIYASLLAVLFVYLSIRTMELPRFGGRFSAWVSSGFRGRDWVLFDG